MLSLLLMALRGKGVFMRSEGMSSRGEDGGVGVGMIR